MIFLKRYDIVITHYNCSNRPDVAIATFLSFSKHRIGYKNSATYKNYWTWAYNHPVTIDIQQTFREMNLLCLETLGIEVRDDYPQFFFSEEDRKGAFDALNSVPPLSKPVILFSPGVSFFSKKRWSYSNFAVVINEFLKRGDYSIIVTGTKQDTEIEQYLSKGYLNCIGKLSQGSFAALISLSDCIVCCEGGAMHIADAFKKKAVAIYGPQNRTWAWPYHKDHIKMIYTDVPCYPCNDFHGHKRMKNCQNPVCINSITPPKIITAIDEIFACKNNSK
jgi:ADP-heptose:LPS heptosyltransferase